VYSLNLASRKIGMSEKLPDQKFLILKFDAGRRQLKMAIRLWFQDDDPVSIHTLAAAAYEILHNLSRLKGGTDLLFDSKAIREDYRKDFIKRIKSTSQFFKHADRDPDGTAELSTLDTEVLLIYSMIALSRMGKKLSMEENAMLLWLSFSNPEIIMGEEARLKISPQTFREFNSIPKGEYLTHFSHVWDAGIFKGRFDFITS
jgi:hypothetical protein